MDLTLNFTITKVNSVNNLDEVCQFFSELTEVFGLSWHPDHTFDSLNKMPGGVEESARIASLINRSFEVCEAAGIEDTNELAYASTRKIRESHEFGTEAEEPQALLFV
jgi:hypothetical protein